MSNITYMSGTGHTRRMWRGGTPWTSASRTGSPRWRLWSRCGLIKQASPGSGGTPVKWNQINSKLNWVGMEWMAEWYCIDVDRIRFNFQNWKLCRLVFTMNYCQHRTKRSIVKIVLACCRIPSTCQASPVTRLIMCDFTANLWLWDMVSQKSRGWFRIFRQ